MAPLSSIKFKCFFVENEINVNALAGKFNIRKKFQWNEPLVLTSDHLKDIVKPSENKSVYIFSFGSIVFLNFEDFEVNIFLNDLKEIEKNLKEISLDYFDDYSLIIDPNEDMSINYNYMTVPKLENTYCEVISVVLAKSTALSRIETSIDILSDKVETIINFLKKGYLKISNEVLAKISGEILSLKYNTISYIMLLDKPDITWSDENSEKTYSSLEDVFELRDRYEKIHHKTEVLLNIIEIFASLTHTKRSTRLEWIVIILIFVEVIFLIITYFFK
ncbi:MAG TPA: RMD1 family protein [Clostridia bacterium]|nr:RMD1 family protein [Clostridia bacterium]